MIGHPFFRQVTKTDEWNTVKTKSTMFSHRRSCSYLMGNYYFCNNCIIAHCFLNFFAFLELSQNFKLVLFDIKKKKEGQHSHFRIKHFFFSRNLFFFPFRTCPPSKDYLQAKTLILHFLLFFLGYSKLPILTLFFLLLLRVIVS